MIQSVCKGCSNIYRSTDGKVFENGQYEKVEILEDEYLIIINCGCGEKVVITK